MRALVFDAGPLISLTMNNLLWLLEPLKQKFRGEFFITRGVHSETVDNPLKTLKFRFEAIQVQRLVDESVLAVLDSAELEQKSARFLETANAIFYAWGRPINIVQRGEMETLAAAIIEDAEAVVVDERTTRLLVESPEALRDLLEKKLHTKITIDSEMLKQFRKEIKDVKLIRSVELVTVAFEKGFLRDYIVSIPDAKKNLLKGVLWGIKLSGCSVSEQDIEEIVRAVQ